MNHSRFPWKGCVHACSTGSCAIFALVGFFTVSDVIKRHVTPEGIPYEGWGSRMRNRKLNDIRLNVTRRASLENMGARVRDRKFPCGVFLFVLKPNAKED